MTRPVVITMLGLAFVAPAADSLTSQSDFFDEGNRRYQEGDFDGALASYLRLEAAGYESPSLSYNLGNTYFKLGDLGHAILFWERARRAAPGDDDLEANLALARSLTVDEVTPLPGFWLFRVVRWWVHLLPRGALVLVVAMGWIVAGTGLVVRILWRGPLSARWGLRVAGMAALLFVVFGINLAAIELGIGNPTAAIVIAPEVNVQSAPSDDPSLQVFAIHVGTKVRIDRRADGWVEIVLEDGKVGWVREEVLERI
jgi:tetratricopeptide (TPR) repeat protein